MLGLLIAGAVVFVIGFLAVGFGIPIKEFSFGNTLIITGVFGVCTGLLMIVLSFVQRELKSISMAIGASSRAPKEQHPKGRLGLFTASQSTMLAHSKAISGSDGNNAMSPMEEDSSVLSSGPAVPWYDDIATRNRVQADSPIPEEAIAPQPDEFEAPAKKRKNLLFTSTKRNRPQPPSEPMQPSAGVLAEEIPMSGSGPQPRMSFEDAWPVSDRPRPDVAQRVPRSPGQGETGIPKASTSSPPVRRPAEAPPVTVLKSGVVDGMAYSLYSDGSIEAQMPEGMVRFASIDALRNHLG